MEKSPADARAEALAGIGAMLPIALAAVPFGMLFGAEAIRQGLSLWEAWLMSLTVFAGGAQFMSMGLWADPVPWVGLALATLVVNLRHTLMSASLAGKMAGFGSWQKAGAAFLLADETWALAERRAMRVGLTPAYYFGIGLTLYVLWSVSTLMGAVLGGLIPDPARFGLDFAFPAIFICLITGFVKDWKALPVILAAGGTAMAVHAAVPGMWFVMAGGLAGIVVAAVLPSGSGDPS
jgi:4-azaleucine resistance transporter AzlC